MYAIAEIFLKFWLDLYPIDKLSYHEHADCTLSVENEVVWERTGHQHSCAETEKMK